MTQRDDHDAERMEELILAALGEIFRHPQLPGFLAWAQQAIPQFLELPPDELTADETRRLGALFGIAIWNATPLPDNGYRPQPVPIPEPHQACLCGSGRPFANCCAQAELPEMPPDLIWELLLAEFDDRTLHQAIKHQAIPGHLLARVAERWLDDQRPGRAAQLLEPLFASDLNGLDGRYEDALNLLCEAYDALDYHRKKQRFLRQLTQNAGRELRAAAWQQLCSMHLNAGHFDQAHAAFAQALRNAPDSPANALLEITLLAAQHQDGIARERARFWHGRLKRAGVTGSYTLDFLTQAIADPQDALAASHAEAMDPRLLMLRDWIERHQCRPLPQYRFERSKEDKYALFDGQLSLFEAQELPLPPGALPMAPVAALTAPPTLRRLERAWHRRFPASKPFATELSLFDGGDTWSSDGWLTFLDHHPQAIDSLDVLDDLATAIDEHPDGRLPWIRARLLSPLYQRAAAILEQSQAAQGLHRLPWSTPANRPLLRLLFRLYRQQRDVGDSAAAGVRLEQLLQLNPSDDHGIRAELMNHYLRQREDEKAVALARRFPTDVLAELAYGEVLALYRLGRTERAAAVLHEAFGRLPRVPRYLTRKRIKRPRLAAGRQIPGSEDQAWLYREAMRDLWISEPGLLAWMQQLTA